MDSSAGTPSQMRPDRADPAQPPPSPLNPAQQRVLTDLMALGQERPQFPAGLAPQLRLELEQELEPVAAELGGEVLWLRKSDLGRVHTCESHFRSELDTFEWNARTVRGTVVHRAVQLSVSARGDPAPLELVDFALDRLAADDRRTSPSSYLGGASPLELAELRAEANDVVVKFLECWPPIQPKWSPCTETGIGADLCDERFVLWGKVDLVLGRARGHQARGLIIDLKTGRSHAHHLDDLRFYALIQTLRLGVPPFRVASYYLDTATFHYEDVTVDTLEIAVRRTVDGARKIAELRAGRPPAITPGPTCGWCRLAATCEGPLTLAAAADDAAG